MGAENPIRRSKTARELAHELGISERSIRNIAAEPRGDYEARTRAKEQRAQELRSAGLKYRQIAEEMGISIGSVSVLLHPRRQESRAS
ncbi:replication protein RepB [Nocardia yamanashiensis]|uniref:replication protein RepB n=1 Tax=Nocardia yamanashiensis TaxID=209247 RepID=UPI0009FE49E1|nr:replication protein RepB [Nocardia yamanashiensis]